MQTAAAQITNTLRDHRIARHAAIAIALSAAEAAIPTPLPGVKPGLANIVVLLVLLRYGWAEAVWVSLLRVLVGSLIVGQFLTPGFWLSLSGALCSLAILWPAQKLPSRWFGPVSLSILSSFAHMGGQLLLARAWLIPHDGVWLLAPIFGAFALLFGFANGLAVARLLQTQTADQPDTALN